MASDLSDLNRRLNQHFAGQGMQARRSGLVIPGQQPPAPPPGMAEAQMAAEAAERLGHMELLRRCLVNIQRAMMRARDDLQSYGLHPAEPDGLIATDKQKRTYNVEVVTRLVLAGEKPERAKEVDALVERLAAAEHAGWAHWMRYLFSVSTENEDGSVTIPADSVAHWKRQVETVYADLTEREKESDRVEVRKILPLILAALDGNFPAAPDAN